MRPDRSIQRPFRQEWVDWFNTRRRFEPIGNVPPAEAEARYFTQAEAQASAA